MSASVSVEVDGFFVNQREVRKHGVFAVASNRLRGGGINPTEKQILALASRLQETFPECGRGPVPSVPRF
jgi:hypothetical protein